MQITRLLWVTTWELNVLEALFADNMIMPIGKELRLKINPESIKKFCGQIRFLAPGHDARELFVGLLSRLKATEIIAVHGEKESRSYQLLVKPEFIHLEHFGPTRETREVDASTMVSLRTLQKRPAPISIEDIDELRDAALRQQMIDLGILHMITNGEECWFVAARCFEKFELTIAEKKSGAPQFIAPPPPPRPNAQPAVIVTSSVQPDLLARIAQLQAQKTRLEAEAATEASAVAQSTLDPTRKVDPMKLNDLRRQVREITSELLRAYEEMTSAVQAGGTTRSTASPIPRGKQSGAELDDAIPAEIREMVSSGIWERLSWNAKVLLIAHFGFATEASFASTDIAYLGKLIDPVASWTMYVHNCCFQSGYLAEQTVSAKEKILRSLHHKTEHLFTISAAGNAYLAEQLEALTLTEEPVAVPVAPTPPPATVTAPVMESKVSVPPTVPAVQVETEVPAKLRAFIDSGHFDRVKSKTMLGLIICYFGFGTRQFSTPEFRALANKVTGKFDFAAGVFLSNTFSGAKALDKESWAVLGRAPDTATVGWNLNETGRSRVESYFSQIGYSVAVEKPEVSHSSVVSWDPATHAFSTPLQAMIRSGKFATLVQDEQVLVLAREIPMGYKFARSEFITLAERTLGGFNWSTAFNNCQLRFPGTFKKIPISRSEVEARGLHGKTKFLYTFIGERKDESRHVVDSVRHPVAVTTTSSASLLS